MLNAEPHSWKHKYLQVLNTLELEQKTHCEQDQALRQALSRLSLAVETNDEQLNSELNILRKTLRGGGEIQYIQQLMEDISASILRVDLRQNTVNDIDAALRSHERSLEHIRVPRELRKATRQLKQSLQAARKKANLRAALTAYSHYTAEVTEWIDTQPIPNSSGLFERIFARKEEATAAPDDRTSAPEAQPQPIQSELPPFNLPPFNQVLFDLLSRIDLPAEFDSQTRRIGECLHQPPTTELASTAVIDIADLMAKSRHQLEREKKDLEGFLSQLTERLQALDRHLGESFGLRERASAEGSAIDDSMSAEVAHIHRSVAEAQDFSGLKSSIKTHLENIQVQIEARKELEQTQLELALADAAHLRESLAKVETESQQLRERLREARERALHDGLTGLHNRLAYDEYIGQEMERWRRYARPAVLSIWDIDHFKRVNDRFGHIAGDNALKAIARLLQDATRKSDFLARLGGEEFMLLLPETDIETALELANRLRERVATQRFKYLGQPVPLNISCGLATFIAQDTPEALYHRADLALYRAKETGRNRCVVFEPGMLPKQAPLDSGSRTAKK
ncbi:GGDEF domain-containing protein [Rhabdochromatium marinum]|uniref:GGDEF domain-containing protein n=1 Tax=Rhabdochromatium marinum TaxID=48729 RepID=UPI00190803CD|nr:GGDEF domain-containing protein [Rhabdochromatium marinum]MBK1648660.1 hypothetical protein [Rhabdochromatium marinum]